MRRAFDYPEGVTALRLETLRSRSVGLAVHVFRAGPWLIDSGPRHARRQLLRWRGLDGAEACLLTHHDEDHAGNAAALAARGVRVLAGPEVVTELAAAGRLPLYRRWVWGAPQHGSVGPLAGEIAGGGWRLVALHTPGHSADHFVFHEPDRGLVFSGDLYVARRVPLARPREDIAQLLASLRRVRALGPRTMFCSHRGRIERPGSALDAKIAWLEELVARVQELARAGLSLGEITRRALGRESLIYWASRGEYCKRNLIEAALRARP